MDENVKSADVGFGNKIDADILLTLPDGAKIGLVWDAKKKSYTVKADFYYGSIQKLLGGDLRRLKQQHAYRKVETLARKYGYRVSKATVDPKTGEMQLFLYGK